jgi:hypothetical protein
MSFAKYSSPPECNKHSEFFKKSPKSEAGNASDDVIKARL